FNTPRGERAVLAKERDPVWTPPLWHYVEVAKKKEFRLVELKRGREVMLGDSSRLVIRGDTVGQLRPDSIWIPIPPDEEILFDETVFVPPIGTINRRIEGELGKFKLDMGDGYLLHGTRDSTSIGTAATHGCIRVGDRDLERIFKTVPVGTPVFIR
ncbi:MAG: L,D-transpeptidase, partial [Gemmatimonadota bacterium]|nr:L,D-transpeptidase [Gemmatimonadota bacterium]